MTTESYWTGKRFWLVGASEGLGRALAANISAVGSELILSARNEERLEELASTLPGPARVLPCDLASRESIDAIAPDLGTIDGVVLMAGYYEPMTADAWDADTAEKMCDINLTGAVRALGVAIPLLLARGSGHIAIIGSLAGLRGLPGNIGYGASKAGVMHLAECLRLDLDPGRYKVQVINPGFIDTRLTRKNDFNMPFLMTAEDAAHRTRIAMERNAFRADFPRRLAVLFWTLGLLPNALYFPIVRRLMG